MYFYLSKWSQVTTFTCFYFYNSMWLARERVILCLLSNQITDRKHFMFMYLICGSTSFRHQFNRGIISAFNSSSNMKKQCSSKPYNFLFSYTMYNGVQGHFLYSQHFLENYVVFSRLSIPGYNVVILLPFNADSKYFM